MRSNAAAAIKDDERMCQSHATDNHYYSDGPVKYKNKAGKKTCKKTTLLWNDGGKERQEHPSTSFGRLQALLALLPIFLLQEDKREKRNLF